MVKLDKLDGRSLGVALGLTLGCVLACAGVVSGCGSGTNASGLDGGPEATTLPDGHVADGTATDSTMHADSMGSDSSPTDSARPPDAENPKDAGPDAVAMDSGTVDSAHDSDTGPDAPDAEDARSDATDAMDSGTVDSALGEDASGVLLSIPLPNMQPSGLAIDQTNNKLYVAVVDPNTGNNLGFSVIDTLTQAVSGSIAPPVVNGVPVQGYYGSELLAFDPGANLLYAVPGGTTVDVFDGATNTFKTSFSIAGPPLTEVCDGIIWLAIDSASSREASLDTVPERVTSL